jgi:SAM-dependent methyltransferase
MKTFSSLLTTLFITIWATNFAFAQQTATRTPDVPYVPTRQAVVDAMLKLAKVSKNDVVYDLGCGDGRIVITAAKQYGATGTGIDINPERIKEANENAQNANVTDKVKFLQADLFETDFSKASVVTLYLLPSVNMKLRPILLKQLKPGTRIVSHAFNMGDWEPEQKIEVDGSTIYFWTVPPKK